MMRWTRSLGPALLAGAILCQPTLAGDAPEGLAHRVLEGIKLSLARLDTLAGTARFGHPVKSAKAQATRIRFFFKKPFQLLVDETTRSFSFSHFDGQVALYFPRERDLLAFSVGDSDASLLRRVVELLEVRNFTPGFGLEELGAHFTVTIKEREGYDVQLSPHPASFWRRSIGLHRVEVHLEQGTYLPRQIKVYERLRLATGPRLAFTMELEEFRINVPIPDTTFRITYPRNANRLSALDLAKLILTPCLREAKDALEFVGEKVQNRLKRFTQRPWEF